MDKVFQIDLNASLKEHKQRTAIRYGDRGMSYLELDEKAAVVSSWIQHSGIPMHSPIGIYTNDKLDFILILIGILRAGRIFVPLDPSLPMCRIGQMIDAVELKYLFTEPGNALPEGLKGTAGRSIQVIDIHEPFAQARLNRRTNMVADGLGSDDPIYIYFTSGTTGVPKAILGKNKSLRHFIRWEIGTFGIDSNCCSSQLISVGFDAFLRDLFVPLLAGGVLCIPQKQNTLLDSYALVQWIKENRINLIHCVPSLFRLILQASPRSEDFKHLKYILMSGEKIHPCELRKWYDTFDERIQLVNLYGPTETTMVKTFYLIGKSDVECLSIPIGKPMAGCQVIVLDSHLNVCDTGVPGEICIRTPFATHGYCNNPELNHERFILNPFSKDCNDRLYKTGDIGRVMHDGNLELLGRADRQVKIRGVRVELEEIENILLRYPYVKEAVVVAKLSQKGEYRLCAYIVFKHTPSPISQNETERYKRQLLINGWGLTAQRILSDATVLVAGAGGSGSAAILQLALIGFGTIIVCDYDRVELSNLNRQCLHDHTRIGMNKASSAKLTVAKINPHVRVVAVEEKITSDNIFEFARDADFIFDNVDDIEVKFEISKCAVQKGIPHIISSMIDLNAYAAVFHPPFSPCFHCLYDSSVIEEIEPLKAMKTDYRKKPLAVVASSLFLSTGFAVNEALKILLGIGKPGYNRFFLFNQKGGEEFSRTDGYYQITYPFSDHFRQISRRQGFNWEAGWRGKFLEEIEIQKNADCPVCNSIMLGKQSRHTPMKTKTFEHCVDTCDAMHLNTYDLEKHLRKDLSQKIPDYMVPQFIMSVDAIPLKSNGKIDWDRLPVPEVAVNSDFQPPETRLEKQIASAWSQVLELDQEKIGRDFNFFDLGGHSLNATKMVALLQRQHKIKIALGEVFRFPTVRQLAERIAIQYAVADRPEQENVVLLKEGSSGVDHLFIVHAGNGQVEPYVEFANRLDDPFSCWGIQGDRISDYAPQELTNEGIAEKYISQIKTICLRGPYYIAGWCLGGPIALEIVRQLEEQDDDVRFFGLVDSNVPASDWMQMDLCQFTPASECQYLESILADEALPDDWARMASIHQLWAAAVQWLETIPDILMTVKEKIIQHHPPFRRSIDKPVIPFFDQIELKDLIYYINVIRSYRNARASYAMKGRIRQPSFYFKAKRTFIKDEMKRWNQLFHDPLKVIQVAGDHYSVFQVPEIDAFASVFSQELIRAKYRKRNRAR